jgi:tetratricopeptide (TPR) repeat protein
LNSKNKLRAFFDSKQDNEKYIQKYEENMNFFNDLLTHGHKEDIEFILPIKLYKYADPLNKTGNYKKALSIISEVENELNKIKGQSKYYNQLLEGVTFLTGVCLGKLKKYRESNREFEKLLRSNPDNRNFIGWYKTNQKNEISRIKNRVIQIGIVFYLTVLLIEMANDEIKLFLIREIGLLIAFLAMGISYILKKKIDKRKIVIE